MNIMMYLNVLLNAKNISSKYVKIQHAVNNFKLY